MFRFFLFLFLATFPNSVFAYKNYKLTLFVNVNLTASETLAIGKEDITLYVLDEANSIHSRTPIAVKVKVNDARSGGLTFTTETIEKALSSTTGIVFGKIAFGDKTFFLPISAFSTTESHADVRLTATILYEKFFRNGFPLNTGASVGFFNDENFPVILHSLRVFLQEGVAENGIPETARNQMLVLFKQNKDYFRSRSERAEQVFQLLFDSTDGQLSAAAEVAFLSYFAELISTSTKLTTKGGHTEPDYALFAVVSNAFFTLGKSAQLEDQLGQQLDISLNYLNSEKQYFWCMKFFTRIHFDLKGLPAQTKKDTVVKILSVAAECAHSSVSSDENLMKDNVAAALLALRFDDTNIGREFMMAYMEIIKIAEEANIVNSFSDFPKELGEYFYSYKDVIGKASS